MASVRSDEGAALSDSGSHVPEGDVRVDGAASAEGKREVEDRTMATLSVALEGARFSAPPPPKELLPQRNSDGAERRQRESDDDHSREAKEGKVEPLPTVGIAHSAGPQQDTTTMDDISEESVNGEEKKTAVAKDDDDHIDDDDDDDDYGDNTDNEGIDGALTIGLAPPMSPSAFDTGAAVNKASGKGRPESRQEHNGSEEEKGRDKKLEDEEDKEGEIEGLDEVSEMLEMVDSEDSKEEMEVTGVQGASGEQEQGLDAVRGKETRTEPYVSNAAAAERATIATPLSGIGNDSVLDTLRESTGTPEEEVGQPESDDSAGKSPLNSERSTVPSGRRGIGHTDNKNIAEIEVPMPGDRGAAAKPSASSPPLPLPTPVAAVLAPPPRSLSPSSLLPETGASSASSLAGLPLPPVGGGGRPRFGLLGSLPPVGGRGLPSLALRSGAGIGETKIVADSSDATTAISGADRSDHNNSAPPPPPPASPGVFGSSARTEGAAGGGGGGLDRSDSQGDDVEDVEGSTSKAVALPGSPRQHQGQEEEAAGVGSTEDTQDLDRVTAVAGEKAQGGGQTGGREESGGYFGDSGGEISEEDIPEEVSSGDDDISFEQDSSDGGAGAGGGDDDYFS